MNTMANQNPPSNRECLVVYDDQCRLCVTAKQRIERVHRDVAQTSVRFVPYHSEEAARLLKEHYRPGRPDAAFLVGADDQIIRGLDAFLPLLPGLWGGRAMALLMKLPLFKPLAYMLYRVVARNRYRWFGSVNSSG